MRHSKALCLSWQHQQIFHFSSPSLQLSLCSRYSVLSSVLPFTLNSLIDLARTVFILLLYYQRTKGQRIYHSFLPGNDAADELVKRGALILPSAVPCSFSPLTSRIFFIGLEATVLSKFFDSHILSVSTEEVLFPRQARCVLSRLWCNRHSILSNSYLSRIGRI